MKNNIIRFLAVSALIVPAAIHGAEPVSDPKPVAAETFQPTDESLRQYRCPDWFRDAKFGIWAHWGPQCVPENGDWYARNMYVNYDTDKKGDGTPKGQNPDNRFHMEHYGHPSQFGFKDIIPLWKAEKWDPERLMSLYKKAGAKYFVSMGCTTTISPFIIPNSPVGMPWRWGRSRISWPAGSRKHSSKACGLASPNTLRPAGGFIVLLREATRAVRWRESPMTESTPKTPIFIGLVTRTHHSGITERMFRWSTR
jgi:hypothetical protein